MTDNTTILIVWISFLLVNQTWQGVGTLNRNWLTPLHQLLADLRGKSVEWRYFREGKFWGYVRSRRRSVCEWSHMCVCVCVFFYLIKNHLKWTKTRIWSDHWMFTNYGILWTYCSSTRFCRKYFKQHGKQRSISYSFRLLLFEDGSPRIGVSVIYIWFWSIYYEIWHWIMFKQ